MQLYEERKRLNSSIHLSLIMHSSLYACLSRYDNHNGLTVCITLEIKYKAAQSSFASSSCRPALYIHFPKWENLASSSPWCGTVNTSWRTFLSFPKWNGRKKKSKCDPYNHFSSLKPQLNITAAHLLTSKWWVFWVQWYNDTYNTDPSVHFMLVLSVFMVLQEFGCWQGWHVFSDWLVIGVCSVKLFCSVCCQTWKKKKKIIDNRMVWCGLKWPTPPQISFPVTTCLQVFYASYTTVIC